jgi:gliding motility-associated-like protein
MKKLLLFFMSLFTFFAFGQLSEGFEGATFPPQNWSILNNGIGLTRSWTTTSATGLGWVYAGGKAAIINKEDVSSGIAEDWMVTPLVNVPVNGQLRFFARSIANGEQGSVYKVKISTTSQTDQASFVDIVTPPYTELDIINAPFEQKIIPLTAYVGQSVYIAFVMENDNGDAWIIDNVNVDEQCFPPTAINSVALSTTANLSWTYTGSTNQFEIEYGPAGFVQGTGTIVSPVTNPYTLTGLSSLTNYTYYVRALCGIDNSSSWSVAGNFTTTALPPVCGGNFIDSGGSSGPYSNNEDITTTICPTNPGDIVTITFTSFNIENRWDALYVYDGNSIASPIFDSGLGVGLGPNAGISGGFWGTTVIGPFTASSSNGCLTFRFRSDGSGTRTGWIANVTCTPPPTCPRPSLVSVSAIGQTQASINWIENGAATQWQVLVLPVNSPIPTAATPGWQTTSIRPYIYTGLNPGTQYKAYVRSICSLGVDESDVSVAATFATQIANDECAAAINVPVNIGTACINSVDGTVLGATPSPNPNGCAGNDDDDVWFQFTATEGTHNITLVNVEGSTTDLYHVVYSGSCGALTQLYCSDDNSSIATNLTPGQTYYIRVYTFTGTAGQNTTFTMCVGTPVDCSDASAFCGETGLVYTNSVGVPSYGSIGCLFTSPNPSWYFMQVSQSGNLNFQIAQVDNTGTGIDVDYIVWGPFTPAEFAASCNDLYDFPDGNTTIPDNIASCSYSFVSVENFTINNAVLNDIYIVLITNFSGDPGTVTFTQTNLNGTGAGSTNCDIVCTNNIGTNQVLCADSYQIVSSNTTADAYQWFFNGVLIPGETLSTLTVYQSGTYKCRITCGINTVEDEITVTLNDTIVPTFSTPGAICLGAANIPLSTTSLNGVTGQWNLAGNPVTQISTATAGTFLYVFTPTVSSFPCSPPFEMNVEIIATCTFNSFATAVWVENCTNTATDGAFYNVTGVGTDLIGASGNIFPDSNLGTYVQNSGNLILRGAELKSFKTSTSNVCSARLNYRIYQASAAPGPFTILNLPFFDDCVAGNFASGGTCNIGDQKWQEVLNDSESPIDLTLLTPGNYVVELYFDLTGDNNSTVDCDDTILVNNGGVNYIANFTIQASPIFTSTNEQCGSSNATITASGFIPGTTYSVSYTDNSVVVGPTNYIANSNGQIILSGLNTGTYADFNFQINGCTILVATPIVITNFSPSITQVTSNTEICVGANAVFTIEGSPNFNVSYTINGGVPQSTTLNASGLATVTINTPPAGNVILQLINIFNTSCSIPFANSSTVLVNALPTATLSVVDSNICIGVGNADFVISGTPNATVSYTINGGATQTATIDATGSVTVSVALPTADVTLELTGVTLGICSNVTPGQTSTIVVTSIPVPVINVTQTPVCANQTASFTVTSPINTQLNSPGNLFISEITDHTAGALTYVEIYNGTGSAVDLANYKLKVYTNATGTPTCNLALSGILANDDVVVVKLSNSANQGGIVPDLTFTTCLGVNNNDNIVLTTSTDVELDNWGVNQVVFTPGGGVGYNYRRISTAVLPSMTWDPADWDVIDWTNTAPNLPDYSDVGYYSLYVTNYEYTLSDGVTTSTQSSTNFTGVSPGNYTLIATDLVTGCNSSPLNFTINPVVFANPVTTFSYTTPVCISSGTNPVPNTSAVGFASGGTYGSTAGLAINASTGVIDLANSTPGTYVVTYSVTIDATNCLNAGSSQSTIEITANNPTTFSQIDDLCIGTTIQLPLQSIEGITGTWSPSVVNNTEVGVITYTFTPDINCSDIATLDIRIIGCDIPKGVSPNGDGLNDTWDLSGYNVKRVEIFNRYGTKVYSKSNYVDEWHGQSDNSNELPDGTYYYVVEFNDSPVKTGWVYINREQ